MWKNLEAQTVEAQLIEIATGNPFAGEVTVYVTGNGGTQVIGSVDSGVCEHKGNGLHVYRPSAAETNFDNVAFTFVGSGAITHTLELYPKPVPVSAFEIAGAIIALLAASSYSSVLTASNGTPRYSARVDVEQVFGAINIKKWADLDNAGDEDAIAQRIDATIADADAEIDARLRGSIARLPFAAPIDRCVMQLSARLAGVKLYEARGVQDFDEVTGAPQHRLTWHRREVERMLKDIRSGRIRLKGSTYVATPQAVEDDD